MIYCVCEKSKHSMLCTACSFSYHTWPYSNDLTGVCFKERRSFKLMSIYFFLRLILFDL